MVIGKGLEALDWDTSEAAGWLRVEADGGGSWLVRIRLFLPKHWIIFSNGTWTYDICVAFWCRYLKYVLYLNDLAYSWMILMTNDERWRMTEKWWTMNGEWWMMTMLMMTMLMMMTMTMLMMMMMEWWIAWLIDWMGVCLLVCLFCFVLFVCLFVCPKPFWSLEVLWLRVCDLHIIIEKNHCICSMIWIELALPYSLQGLDRWKRQLVSVLRDGHALLTTLNEGATLSGSMVT